MLAEALLGYAGRWVAIIDHVVVQDAATLDDLLDRLDQRQRDRARILRVAEHPKAVCFY
jgi:Family of unknown function (DUF5678)